MAVRPAYASTSSAVSVRRSARRPNEATKDRKQATSVVDTGVHGDTRARDAVVATAAAARKFAAPSNCATPPLEIAADAAPIAGKPATGLTGSIGGMPLVLIWRTE